MYSAMLNRCFPELKERAKHLFPIFVSLPKCNIKLSGISGFHEAVKDLRNHNCYEWNFLKYKRLNKAHHWGGVSSVLDHIPDISEYNKQPCQMF